MSRRSAREHREAEVKSFSKSTWWEFDWLTGAAAFIISNHWKTPLVPTPGCGRTYWSCLRFQVVEASVGHLGAPGTPPWPSIPRQGGRICTCSGGLPAFLMFQASHAAGEGSPLPGVHPCRDTLARGSACVLLWGQNFDLPSSENSKVLRRIERGEEVTEHVTTQRYCPPPGNPLSMGEGFLCQKAQPDVFPKGSLGLQVSKHNKEHLLACSALY